MYNSWSYAIVIYGGVPMNNKLLTQLKILKLMDTKPNFSELARIYSVDRRTIKKYYDGYEGKPKHHDNRTENQ